MAMTFLQRAKPTNGWQAIDHYIHRCAASKNSLSIAYSPGVAEPCLAIKDDPDLSYEYTTRGHLVGVVSNGTAVLGLGNIGAAASKPVMVCNSLVRQGGCGMTSMSS